MEAIAEFVARHAALVLLGATVVLLLAAAVFWRLVVAYAPAAWRMFVAAWNLLVGTTVAGRARTLPVLGRTLSGTLGVARFLGVFSVMAFGLAACALVFFVELADEIGAGESLGEFDVVVSTALHEHLPYQTLRLFALITHLGDPGFLVALCSLVAVFLLVRRRRDLAAAWVVATASGALLNRLLKALFERTRPLHDHGLANEAGFSFPSGHASGSMIVYGLLGYLLVRHTPNAWHIPVALISVALVVFVGSSRVLLQVHYVSDVLAGYAVGAAWVAAWVAALEAVRWQARSGGDVPAVSRVPAADRSRAADIRRSRR